jgi:hypothetical protein
LERDSRRIELVHQFVDVHFGDAILHLSLHHGGALGNRGLLSVSHQLLLHDLCFLNRLLGSLLGIRSARHLIAHTA